MNSPEALADAFQDLGNLYYLREDYKDAEELYQNAFALLRKNNMTATVVYGKLYGDLADIYEKRGQLSEAEKAIRQELGVFLAAKFSDVSVPLGNLAKLLVMMGRAGEAEPIYNSLGAKPSAVKKTFRRTGY